MPTIRFTFQGDDRNVEALLHRVQQALRDVKAAEEGAADEFSAIVAGARQALAVATEQVAQARAHVEQVRARAQAEIAAARATAQAQQDAAQRQRLVNQTAIANAQAVAQAVRAEGRERVAAAREVLQSQRATLAAAEAEERALRRQTAQQAQLAAQQATAARRRFQDAQSVLTDLRLRQSSATVLGGQSEEDRQRAREAIQQQRELVETLRLEAQARQRAKEQVLTEARAAREAAAEKTRAARLAVSAAREEVRAQQQLLASARQAAQARVAAAQQTAAAQQRAGRFTALQAQQEVAAARLAARAQVDQATQALHNARAVQTNAQAALGAARAQLGLANAHRQAGQATGQQTVALQGLTSTLARLFAAVQGARLFARFINEGLKFNQTIETATLAIGSLIDAESDIALNGRPVRDMEKLAVSVEAARHQVDLLRVAGLQTAATTEQLIDAFQQAVGAGVAAGLSLDEVRKITIQIVQAAGALGVPLNQLNQEVRSILDATIDRNSRVARVLGITNEQVRLAKEQNTLADFLNRKLEAFTTAGQEAAKTWLIIKSNMLEALQVFAGDATKPLFENLKKGFQGALNAMFDFKNARISEAFKGLIGGLNEVFGQVGDLLAAAIQRSVEGAEALSEWFQKNREQVELLVDAIGDAGKAIGELIAEAARLTGEITNWGTQTGVFAGVLRTAADIIRGVIQFVETLTTKFGLATAAAGLLAGVIARVVQGATLAEALGALGFLATPIGLVIAAATALLVVWNTLEARQDLLLKQQEALARAFEETTAKIIDQSTEYAKLAKQINDGKLSGDELQAAQEKLIALAKDLAGADARYATALAAQRKATQLALDGERQLGREHQALQLKIDELKGKLAQHNLTQREAAQLRHELAVATTELRAKEDAYKQLLDDQKGSYATLLAQLVQIADARVQEAQAQFLQARAAQTMLKVQAEQARAKAREQGASGDLAEAKRQLDLAKGLDQGVQAVNDTVNDLAIRLSLARTAAQRLKDALAAPDITITGRERPSDLKNRRSRQENDAKQFAQAELARIKALLDLTEELLKDSFSEHEISIKEFHDRMVTAQTDAINAQIRVHQHLITQLSDKGDIEREKATIEGLLNERNEIIGRENRDILKDNQALAKEVAAAHLELLNVTGHEEEAQIAQIRAKFSDLRKSLLAEVRAGTPGAERQLALVDQLLNVEIFKVRIENVRQLIERLKTEAQSDIQDIAARVQAGALPQAQGAEETVKVYERIIFTLKQAQVAYQDFADATHDPAAEEALTLLQKAINALIGPMHEAEEATHRFSNAIFGALQSSLATFFSTGIAEAHGFADAFRSLALSVVQSIQQIIAQIIAFKIASAIFKAFGLSIPFGSAPPGAKTGGLIGPAGVPTAPGFRDGGVVPAALVRHLTWIRHVQDMPAFSVGGRVVGPGTDTSDSVPIRVSPGEYVIRAAKVRELGVEFFDDINFGVRGRSARRKRAYADGGVVTDGETRQNDAVADVLGKLLVAPDEGAQARFIASRQGRRLIVEAIGTNPKAVRRQLGL